MKGSAAVDVAELGLTMNPKTAAALFDVSTDCWYDAIRAGTCPIPVLRIGRRIVHPVAAAKAVLGISDPDPA